MFLNYLPIKMHTKVISEHVLGIEVIVTSGASNNETCNNCLAFSEVKCL